MWSGIYAGALVRLLWGSVYLTRQWSAKVAIFTIAGHVAALVFALIQGRSPTGARPFAIRLFLITGASGALFAVIGMSGSAVYAQLAATAGVAIFICSVFAWWQRSGIQSQQFPIGMILLVLGYHLWLAHFFAELTLVNGALLLGAVASCSSFAWSESRGIWLARIWPIVLGIGLAMTALGHAGYILSQRLANPYG
jgi:hypothetical protein